MKTTKTLCVFALALVLAACGKKSKRPEGGEGGEVESGADATGPGPATPSGPAPIGTQKITGKVTYAGEVGTKKLSISVDTHVCGSGVLDPSQPQVEGGKLKNVALHLEGTPKGADPRGAAVSIDQQKCRYVPYVQTATRGAALHVPNSDNVNHNVHGFGPGGGDWFNVATLPGSPAKADLSELGAHSLKCDIHPWMFAWVWVFDHPYHASTGETGTFELPAPPPGEYELVAWHEKLGQKKLKVTVPAEGDVSIDVAY